MNKKNKLYYIVGPIYPFKGGIAHYTCLSARALKRYGEVKVLSFKVQYPKILYPGESQKDYNNDKFKFNNTDYLLNTVNPFSWVRSAVSIIRANPEKVIINWWHPFFAPAYIIMCSLIRCFSKVQIIFIIHNIFPHEKFPLQKLLTKLTLKLSNRVLVQSQEDYDTLSYIIPNAHLNRIVHPTYSIFMNKDLSLEKARDILNLELEQKVLLFFGFIRDYKGLMYLIRALPAIAAEYPEIRLLIVGDFFDDKKKYIDEIEKLNLDEYIYIYNGYIPDEDVGKFFISADVIVLPYTSATQSGIIQIAYGLEKPVIATAVGGLPEVVEHEKTGFLVPPKDSAELSKAIIRFFSEEKSCNFKQAIINMQSKYSWERFAEIIISLKD